VLDILEKRFAAAGEDVWECSDFHCLELARNTYSAHLYAAATEAAQDPQGQHLAAQPEGWKVVYHQGTGGRGRLITAGAGAPGWGSSDDWRHDRLLRELHRGHEILGVAEA